jgi:hypothetical protein
MHDETGLADWLDARCTVPQPDLALMCRLSGAEIEELVDYGLLAPASGNAGAWVFSAACVEPLRKAGALRAQFDLDLFVLGLLYSQFQQIVRLEEQVRMLEAHLPGARPRRDGPERWHEPHG